MNFLNLSIKIYYRVNPELNEILQFQKDKNKEFLLFLEGSIRIFSSTKSSLS